MDILSKETQDFLTSLLLSALSDPKSFEEAEALYAETFRTTEEFYLSECDWLDDYTKDQMVDEVAIFLCKQDPKNATFVAKYNQALIEAKEVQAKAFARSEDNEDFDYWDAKVAFADYMECWQMDIVYMAKDYKDLAQAQINKIQFCETVNYMGEGEGVKPVVLCSKMRVFNGKYNYD